MFVDTIWSIYAKIPKSGDNFSVTKDLQLFFFLLEFFNSVHDLIAQNLGLGKAEDSCWGKEARYLWGLPGAGVTKLEACRPLSCNRFPPQIFAQYKSCEGQEAKELR